MAVSIITGVIQVNQFYNNANMVQGKAALNAWDFVSKINLTFGQISGNLNLIPSGLNVLSDPDLIETNIPNNGGQSPVIGNNAEVV